MATQTKHAENIVAATAVARVLSGEFNGHGAKTLEYAGPEQHVRVRTEIGTDATEREILSRAGIKNAKALKAIATGEADRSEMRPMRDLARKMVNAEGNPDSWARGRYLAAILYAWIAEIRRDARNAKKAAATA